MKEANDLLNHYRLEPSCYPSKAYLRGNDKCGLALTGFPNEYYDTQWGLIMIDVPRGWFPEAPGRMARKKKESGVTHMFLKVFAEEFLCMEYLVKSVRRLWHFEIPPAS
ncbi:hypothetical protein V6N13_034041 [Hibiscus sabdariffa]|uniref:Uncharacterized protein n=1 Tax=Hibiscus sabdariffa TaxID=183260 RepID=A0ABR2F8Z4_9ROSI